jgi:hypothetical protein
MPRKGRIRIVGKWEKIAAEERERELRNLAGELLAKQHHIKHDARKRTLRRTSN